MMILAYTPFEPMTCFKTMTLPWARVNLNYRGRSQVEQIKGK